MSYINIAKKVSVITPNQSINKKVFNESFYEYHKDPIISAFHNRFDNSKAVFPMNAYVGYTFTDMTPSTGVKPAGLFNELKGFMKGQPDFYPVPKRKFAPRGLYRHGG
jgi:hypothetical protein